MSELDVTKTVAQRENKDDIISGSGIYLYFENVAERIGFQKDNIPPLNIINLPPEQVGEQFKTKMFSFIRDNEYGQQVVVLTKSLIDNTNEETLKFIIAHELCHIFYRDIRSLKEIYYSSLVMFLSLFWGVFFYLGVWFPVENFLYDFEKSTMVKYLLLAGSSFWLIMIPGFFSHLLARMIQLRVGRMMEEKADYYAGLYCSNDPIEGLKIGVNYLKNVQSLENSEFIYSTHKLTQTILDCHPPIEHRISLLEEAIEKVESQL